MLTIPASARASTGPALIYNPLPHLLGHYEEALVATLRAAGLSEVVRGVAPSLEWGGCSVPSRVGGAARALSRQRRLGRGPHHVLVCWPSFGLLEPLLWRLAGSRARVTLVVHDPEPLRRQFGMGRLCARLGALASGDGGVEVVVHSLPAREALVARGWPRPRLLPHPTAAPAPARSRGPSRRRTMVSVCGQWKPARDLRLLQGLGPSLAAQGRSPVIAGRGWPPVAGWQLRDEFLSEEGLDGQIAASACVVLPYARFFQSGIAVRCVELGTPVVGPRHPFLEDLLGPSWPGLVDSDEPEAWRDAVGAVEGMSPADLAGVHEDYARRCASAWRPFAERLEAGP